MGQQKSTQTSSSEPWKPAQPALQTGLTDAQNLYKGGIGGQVNTASNVTPYATQSTDAFKSAEGMARANMGGQGLSGQYQGIINSGGFNAPQQSALAGIGATANSSFNPMSDPGFAGIYKQMTDSAAGAANASASAAGRYGSPAHQGMVAKSVGEVGSGLLNNAFNTFNQRRDAAQMNQFNAGQTGMSNIGSAYQGMMAPNETLGKVGSSYEDLFTRQINDRNRIFDAQQSAPWDQLARLNAIASGAGSMGGTSSGTATQPGGNMFGQIGGGLLALSGLL